MIRHDFHKLRRLPPYVFSEVNELKQSARARGEDVVDLGMGNPDLPTPSHVVEKIVEAARNPRTHRYSASRGVPNLRSAICEWYDRLFGVVLDPEREAVAVIGSKEGLAHFVLIDRRSSYGLVIEQQLAAARDPQFHSSVKFVLGQVLFPLYYTLLIILIFLIIF